MERMFFPYQDWVRDPSNCVYLGSEANPSTRRHYDYWAIRADGWSPTSRHGMGDADYGSSPLCVAYYDMTHLDRDASFGLHRSQQLTLYYLATGVRPLAEGTADDVKPTVHLLAAPDEPYDWKQPPQRLYFCSLACRERWVAASEPRDIAFGLAYEPLTPCAVCRRVGVNRQEILIRA